MYGDGAVTNTNIVEEGISSVCLATPLQRSQIETDQEGDNFILTEEGDDDDNEDDDDDDDLDEDGSLILGRTSISNAFAALPKYVGAAVGAAVTPREQQVAAAMEESVKRDSSAALVVDNDARIYAMRQSRGQKD